MIHLELFWSFFQIGLFSIGGGYAAMPLIQHQVVELHPWLTLEQFSDIITISQMTPGPIAINSATFVGLQLGGLPGALVATVGCVLPSCVIVLTLAYVYYRYRGLSMVQGVLAGLRPAVVAMIASAGVTLVNLSFFGADALPAGLADVDLIAVLLFAAGMSLRLVGLPFVPFFPSCREVLVSPMSCLSSSIFFFVFLLCFANSKTLRLQ